MKRVKCFLPMVMFVLAFNCGKKCDTFFSRPLAIQTEEYFGVYKFGNWWVYQNKGGTKKDSLYLVTYTDTLIRNRTNCTESQRRLFSIHNVHFANGVNVNTTYEADGTTTSFIMEVTGISFPWFTYFSNSDIIRSLPSPDNPGSNKLDSITINGRKYYDILIGKQAPVTYYFGKNRGLIGWGMPLDTFSLVNFQIQ